MIPKVKTWRIRYLLNEAPVATFYVDAPTKLLARLNLIHGEHGWTRWAINADKVVYSIVRKDKP